jgi:hypothetical protein
MPISLSPSALSVLRDCPRCFWLEQNKGLKRPRGVFPSLPSGMDRILKAHFDAFMAKGELPPEIRSLKGVKLFSDMELLKVWRNNKRGLEWKDTDGNMLHGALDNVLVKGKKLIVFDYKTRGYPLKEDTPESYHDQMDIYTFLLRKNGYETEEYAYLLFYHPKRIDSNGAVVFQSDLIKMEVSMKNAEQLFKDAITMLSGTMPEPAEDCEYCAWQQLKV